MSAISANKAELLAIANAVASEKMIDKSIVIEAMEEAIQKSARNSFMKIKERFIRCVFNTPASKEGK